jgi:hypothetical protein
LLFETVGFFEKVVVEPVANFGLGIKDNPGQFFKFDFNYSTCAVKKTLKKQ